VLPRVLEPEVMDTEEEARDYDAMDHRAVNAAFCDDLLARAAALGAAGIGPSLLDLGTGTALIPIALSTRTPTVRIVAIDLATHMLALAKENVRKAGFQDRIMLESVDAKRLPFASGSFDTTVSNSIIHHIPEPAGVLAEIVRVTAPGGVVFVRDLVRPETAAEIDRLVALHTGEPPTDPVIRGPFLRQRDLLRASLAAALTVDEVDTLARGAGAPEGSVTMTSDRHWTLSFRKR
jgi:ubiquinone/menaquinone biosynthesis C-methylase UbiE